MLSLCCRSSCDKIRTYRRGRQTGIAGNILCMPMVDRGRLLTTAQRRTTSELTTRPKE